LIENVLMQILSKCYIPQTHLKWIVMDMFWIYDAKFDYKLCLFCVQFLCFLSYSVSSLTICKLDALMLNVMKLELDHQPIYNQNISALSITRCIVVGDVHIDS
jgi:hypothetical protein